MDEVMSFLQATNNSVPGLNQIDNAMVKHLTPEGWDTLIKLNSKIWHQ